MCLEDRRLPHLAHRDWCYADKIEIDLRSKMTKKLSIIRFKPKPEHYDQFLADVIENGKDRDPNTHYTVTTADEVIAVVIRDADSFEQSAQDGVVNWLDERRPMLQEYDPVNRHTLPLSGDLVE